MILEGHIIDVLAGLPERSVHCVVTSPPFWSLRRYGTEPQVWGGDGSCGDGGHAWGAEIPGDPRGGSGPNAKEAYTGDRKLAYGRPAPRGAFCTRCHAWKGELGSEPRPDCAGWATGAPCGTCYVCNVVACMRAVQRVLRDDGSLWINIGDSFSGSWGNFGTRLSRQRSVNAERWERPGYERPGNTAKPGTANVPGTAPKNLLLMPFRVALALQADGWILRQRIEWCKTSAMPESVRDRPTTATEPIFLFAKGPKYFYDREAVAVPSITGDIRRPYMSKGAKALDGRPAEQWHGGEPRQGADGTTGNLRNFLVLGPDPLDEPHYAAWPRAIARIAILAGTSDYGVCRACGSPWVRQVERSDLAGEGKIQTTPRPAASHRGVSQSSLLRTNGRTYRTARTVGWSPSCRCGPDAGPPVPATVLDPFAGSGRTLEVAEALGRNSIGVELNPEYVAMAQRRTAQRGLFQHAADAAGGSQ